MGNACYHLHQHQHQHQHQHGGGHAQGHHNKHGHAGNRLTNRRSASSVSPSGNTRLGNPELSLDQDVRHPQMTQEGNQTTHSKVQSIQSDGQQVASMTVAATVSQVDTYDTLKEDKEKDTPTDCKTNDFVLVPTDEEEEDVCPTCLDGYDEENPKIMTKCKHHYHLSCIFEWKERSDTCPVCDEVMSFEETILV